MSEATFKADRDGTIALDQQAPISGSYAGVDAMGLVWSMVPDSVPSQRAEPTASNADELPEFHPPQPVVIALALGAEGRTLATARLVQRFLAPGVRVVTLREAGLVGTLYLPPPARMAQMVSERFNSRQHAYAATLLVYPATGHAIAFPHIVVAPRLSLGGTVAGTAAADREGWRAVLAFLREQFPIE